MSVGLYIAVAMVLCKHGIGEIVMPGALHDIDPDPNFSAGERYNDMLILSPENFTEIVMNNQEAWIIIFHDGYLARAWKTLSASTRGLVWIGLIDKVKHGSFLKSINFQPTKNHEARIYPWGNKKVKADYFKDVETPLEARQEAIKSLPDKTRKLDPSDPEGFLLDSYTSKPSRFPAIILTDEHETSGVFKAIALRFEKYFVFATLRNPTTDDLKKLGINTMFFEFPSIIVLVAKGKDALGTRTGLNPEINAVSFDRSTMGDLNYANIVAFLFTINSQFRHVLPGDNMSNNEVEAQMLDIIEIEKKRFDILDNNKAKEDKKKTSAKKNKEHSNMKNKTAAKKTKKIKELVESDDESSYIEVEREVEDIEEIMKRTRKLYNNDDETDSDEGSRDDSDDSDDDDDDVDISKLVQSDYTEDGSQNEEDVGVDGDVVFGKLSTDIELEDEDKEKNVEIPETISINGHSGKDEL